MTNLLVLLGWGVLALFVFDYSEMSRFVSSAVAFLMQNKEAVLITLAVVVALKVIGRAPQFRGR